MWLVSNTRPERAFRKIVSVGGVAALSLMLGACSGGFSRFEGSGFSNLSQNDYSQDKIVTSSLAPIPGEPIYNGQYNNRNGQYNSRPAPAYANLNTQRSAPPAYRRASIAPVAPVDGERVTVRQGETLYSISERYGVPVNRIKSANNLGSSDVVAGRTLIIPRSRTARTAVAQGSGYKVQPGDSLAAIATRHGLTYQELARYNKLTQPNSLRVGQTIKLPNGIKPIQKTTVASAPAARRIPVPAAKPKRKIAQDVKVVTTKPIRVASASPDLQLPSKPKAAAPKPQRIAHLGKLPKPQAMSASQFRWPVRGRVISGYGSKANGKHNDGINIAVPLGTSVKAAENGVVAYAGSELKGYGNLVLIRHSDGWVSAYAHNSELMVKRGEKVRRGQIIAKAGQSGTVEKPQVHFELRKGSRPMNPMKHLAGI